MTEKDMEIQSLRRELKDLKEENTRLREKLLNYGTEGIDLSKVNKQIEKALQLANFPEDTLSRFHNKEYLSDLICKYMNPFTKE